METKKTAKSYSPEVKERAVRMVLEHRGATLAVHADRRCDLGMVGYEMTMLANRVGHALTPGVRSGTGQ